MSNLAILIAESVPLVVAAIKPHRDCPARFQVLRQILESFFAIRSVVKHAHAVDKIETLGGEGQSKNIRLKGDKLAVCKVFRGDLGGRAQIDSNHARAPSGCNFREAAHATPYVENELSAQVFRFQTDFPDEICFREISSSVIELRFIEAPPLVAKAIRITLFVDEAEHAAHIRELALAGGAAISVVLCLQRLPTVGALQECYQIHRALHQYVIPAFSAYSKPDENSLATKMANLK